MTVKQISVFLENKPNKLAEFTACLSGQGIDLRAISVAEASDFGIVRIIVDDVYNAVTVLRDANYICSVTEVLAVEIRDEAGALAAIIGVLGESNINVEYMYAITTGKKNMAYMIIRVNDNAKAHDAFEKHGIRTVCHSELLK